MSYKGFYKYIIKVGDHYQIIKGNEKFGTYNRLADALYERDRFIAVDWDWDKYVELADTINGYIHIDLPPFNHQPSYIWETKEYWMVRGKGAEQRYYGSYQSLDEAKKVALIYNANITHQPRKFSVRKRIDGKTRFFGYYRTREEAEERVKELMESDWNANTT